MGCGLPSCRDWGLAQPSPDTDLRSRPSLPVTHENWMPVGLAPSQLSHPLGSLEPSAAPALCLGSEPSECGDLGWEGQDPISAGRPGAPAVL